MVQQFSWTDQYFTEEEDTEGGGEGDAVSGPLDMSAPLSTQRHPLLVVSPSLMGNPPPLPPCLGSLSILLVSVKVLLDRVQFILSHWCPTHWGHKGISYPNPKSSQAY